MCAGCVCTCMHVYMYAREQPQVLFLRCCPLFFLLFKVGTGMSGISLDKNTTCQGLTSSSGEGVKRCSINGYRCRESGRRLTQWLIYLTARANLYTLPAHRRSDPLIVDISCLSLIGYDSACPSLLARHRQDHWKLQAGSRLAPFDLVGLKFLNMRMLTFKF